MHDVVQHFTSSFILITHAHLSCNRMTLFCPSIEATNASCVPLITIHDSHSSVIPTPGKDVSAAIGNLGNLLDYLSDARRPDYALQDEVISKKVSQLRSIVKAKATGFQAEDLSNLVRIYQLYTEDLVYSLQPWSNDGNFEKCISTIIEDLVADDRHEPMEECVKTLRALDSPLPERFPQDLQEKLEMVVTKKTKSLLDCSTGSSKVRKFNDMLGRLLADKALECRGCHA